MKCAICNNDRSGAEHELSISGDEYRFFVCNQCEAEKGQEYEDFFDNIRERVKPEKS